MRRYKIRLGWMEYKSMVFDIEAEAEAEAIEIASKNRKVCDGWTLEGVADLGPVVNDEINQMKFEDLMVRNK